MVLVTFMAEIRHKVVITLSLHKPNSFAGFLHSRVATNLMAGHNSLCLRKTTSVVPLKD